VTTAFPAALDAYADPSGVGVQGLTTPTHSGHHTNHNDAIEAIEGKLGTGVGAPPAAAAVLRRTGTGASGWGQVQTGDLTDLHVTTAKLALNAVTQIWAATVSATFPSTTQPIGSGTVLMTDMSVSITTLGGPVLYLFECMANNTAAGNENVFDLFRGGTLLTRRQFHAPVANYNAYLALLYTETPAAGSYTIEARWAVTAGTATSIGTQRSLTIVELRR